MLPLPASMLMWICGVTPLGNSQCLSLIHICVLIHGETVDEGVGRAVQLLGRAKAKAGTVVTDADSIEVFQSEKPLVLIVDDSEMNRAILNEMLKDEYCILEADNGRAALDMVCLLYTSRCV